MVQRFRPECPDPANLDVHENPRGFQSVDPSTLTEPVNFPQHDPKLAPQEPETTIPPFTIRPDTFLVETTTPPQRARPSVGVPARFPDQEPVVQFNPQDFTLRPRVVPQPAETNRFVPASQQVNFAETPATTQPPFIPFNFENPFSNGFTQFSSNQNFGVRPLNVQQKPEVFAGDTAKAPVLGPSDPVLGSIQAVRRPNTQPVLRPLEPSSRPVAQPQQPQVVRTQRPQVVRTQPPVVRTQPPVVRTQPPPPQVEPVFVPETVITRPAQPEAPRSQPNRQPVINDFEPNLATFAPLRPITTTPVITTTVATTTTTTPATTTVTTTTTTTTTTLSTRQRFRSRQRRPFLTSSRESLASSSEKSVEREQPSTSTEATERPATFSSPVRNRNLFNPSNRRVPLNRFRGRQQPVSREEPKEVTPSVPKEEEKEEVRSEPVRPNAIFKRPTRPRLSGLRTEGQRDRPIAVRRRPFFARRRPIVNDEEPKKEVVEEPVEEQKAFLVCSGGKCFRPDTEEVLNADDLKASGSSPGLSQEFKSLLDQMKVLGKNKKDEDKKSHIKFLLESAKVRSNKTKQKFLKTSDLIEMIRSSGILDEDVDVSNVLQDIEDEEADEETNIEEDIEEEEDVGIFDMERSEVKEEKKPLTSTPVVPTLQSSDLEESSEEVEIEVTTIPAEVQIDEINEVLDDELDIRNVVIEEEEEEKEEKPSEDEEEIVTTISPVVVEETSVVDNEVPEEAEDLQMTLDVILEDDIQEDEEEDEVENEVSEEEIASQIIEEIEEEIQEPEVTTLQPEEVVQNEEPRSRVIQEPVEKEPESQEEVIEEEEVKEDEVKKEPVEPNTTLDMIMNVLEHFDLSSLMGSHPEAGSSDDKEVIEEKPVEIQQPVEEQKQPEKFEHFSEVTTTVKSVEQQPESTTIIDGFVIGSTETTTTNAPVIITEESDSGETVHVVLPMGWSPDNMDHVLQEEEKEEVQETTTLKAQQVVPEEVTTTTTTTSAPEPTTTSAQASTTTSSSASSSSTTTTTVKPTTRSTTTTTTTEEPEELPRTFGSSRRINRIRQSLRSGGSSSAESSAISAVKLINARIKNRERPEFVPSSVERTKAASKEGSSDELNTEDNSEQVEQLLDRRKQLFKSRVRIQRPSPDQIQETVRSSGSLESVSSESIRDRLARLKRPSSTEEVVKSSKSRKSRARSDLSSSAGE